MKRLILVFRDPNAALAISLTPVDATVVAFDEGRKRSLGVQRVPPGLIQFAGSPHRTMRLGLYVANDERIAMLFDGRRRFGYALNLCVPKHSEWGELPDEVAPFAMSGQLIRSWQDDELARGCA